MSSVFWASERSLYFRCYVTFFFSCASRYVPTWLKYISLELYLTLSCCVIVLFIILVATLEQRGNTFIQSWLQPSAHISDFIAEIYIFKLFISDIFERIGRLFCNWIGFYYKMCIYQNCRAASDESWNDLSINWRVGWQKISVFAFVLCLCKLNIFGVWIWSKIRHLKTFPWAPRKCDNFHYFQCFID